MNEIWYKGYKIMPATVQLVESTEWTIALYIGLDKGSEWVERYFSAANKYKTKKEAEERLRQIEYFKHEGKSK